MLSDANFAGHGLRYQRYLYVTVILELLVVYAADLPDLMGKTSSVSEVINDLVHKQGHR